MLWRVNKAIIAGYTNGLKLTTFACVAVYVDLERRMEFNFFFSLKRELRGAP